MVDLTNLADAADTVENSTWSITVEKDGQRLSYSDGIRMMEFEDSVNDVAKLDAIIEGIDTSVVEDGAKIELYNDGEFIWTGDVYNVSNEVGNKFMIEGFGALKRLDRKATTREYYDSTVSKAVSGLVADQVDINLIEDFQDVSDFVGENGVDFGSDESNLLDALSRLCEEIGADFYMTNVDYFEESAQSQSGTSINFASFDVTLNNDGIIKTVGFEPDDLGRYKVEVQDSNQNTIVDRERSVANTGIWKEVNFTRQDYEDSDYGSVIPSGSTVTVIVKGADSNLGLYSSTRSGSETLFDYSSGVPDHNNSSGGDFVTVRDTESGSQAAAGVEPEVRPALNVVVPEKDPVTSGDYYLSNDAETNNIGDLKVNYRGGEVFDQVIVKSEGAAGDVLSIVDDGKAFVRYPDPNKANDPELPPDPDVYVYSDKAAGTFEPEGLLRSLAKAIYDRRNQEWREVSLIPSDPTRIHVLDDSVYINDQTSETDIDDNFRVIGRRYVFDPLGRRYSEGQTYYSEIICSNKPNDFAQDAARSKRRFRDFASYAQSTRNTISQSDSEVADSNGALTFSFNVPQRFVEDRAGRDKTIDARLDVGVDEYSKIATVSQSDVASGTKVKTYDTTLESSELADVVTAGKDDVSHGSNEPDPAAAAKAESARVDDNISTFGGGASPVVSGASEGTVSVSVDGWATLNTFERGVDYPNKGEGVSSSNDEETAGAEVYFDIRFSPLDNGDVPLDLLYVLQCVRD